MKNLTFDLLAIFIRNAPDKLTLRQLLNHALSNAVFFVFGNRSCHLSLFSYGLTDLFYGLLTKTFCQFLCSLTFDSSDKNIIDRIDDRIGNLLPIVAYHLTEILKAQKNRNLIGSRRCD